MKTDKNTRQILTTDHVAVIICRDREQAKAVVEAAKNSFGVNGYVGIKRLIETEPGSDEFLIEHTRLKEDK